MGDKKAKEIDWDNVNLYTSIVLANEDMTITFRNVDAAFIRLLIEDRTKILKEVVYNKWYMSGIYDNIVFFGEYFKIVSISKKKVDLVKIEMG